MVLVPEAGGRVSGAAGQHGGCCAARADRTESSGEDGRGSGVARDGGSIRGSARAAVRRDVLSRILVPATGAVGGRCGGDRAKCATLRAAARAAESMVVAAHRGDRIGGIGVRVCAVSDGFHGGIGASAFGIQPVVLRGVRGAEVDRYSKLSTTFAAFPLIIAAKPFSNSA